MDLRGVALSADSAMSAKLATQYLKWLLAMILVEDQ
jgi:hypothetical protein